MENKVAFPPKTMLMLEEEEETETPKQRIIEEAYGGSFVNRRGIKVVRCVGVLLLLVLYVMTRVKPSLLLQNVELASTQRRRTTKSTSGYNYCKPQPTLIIQKEEKPSNATEEEGEDSLVISERSRTTDSTSSKNKTSFITTRKRELPGNKLFVVGPWVNRAIVEHNLQYLPHDVQIHYYNHSTMTQAVKIIDKELEQEANVTGAWDAYRFLRPWAFRADLWRLMILWSQGGMYLDSKMKLLAPIESWASVQPHETASLCSDHYGRWKPTKINITTHNNEMVPIFYNAVISARRRSPIMLEAIKLIIDHVKNRYYAHHDEGIKGGQHCLAITGPIVLGLAATKDNENITTPTNMTYRADSKFFLHKGVFRKPHAEGLPNGKMIVLDQAEYKSVKKASVSKKSYNELCREKRVYCDEDLRNETDPDCNVESFLVPVETCL